MSTSSRPVGRPRAARSTRLVLASGVLLFSSAGALAQATVDPNARATNDGRPAPAKQRAEADLDAWWQDAVFYEVFVRSFADSTQGPLANDGIGDLRGLIERLDYLNDADPDTDTDLGVTALWLMPVMESPSYHGYDVTDYRRIEQDYGTNQDFLDLVEACHQRGIRVTIDLVLNHCSREHPWFVEAAGDPGSPKRDWFIFTDTPPDYKGPWNQKVWHRAPPLDGRLGGGDARTGATNGSFYAIFWAGMPDLNYRNPDVTREMLDVSRFWLDDMHADGFRLDAIRHLIEDGRVQSSTPATHRWLRMYHDELKMIKPDAFAVGEIWSDSDDVSRYVNDQMDLAFEFQTADAILASVRTRSSAPLLEQLRVLDEKYPLGMYATFLRNHDQPRTMTELEGDDAGARLAASIQFAMPGVAYIYYGEELGMTGAKPDPDIRTPMQWTDGEHAGFTKGTPWRPANADAATVNVRRESSDPGSLLSHYRRLIRARLDGPCSRALRIGTLTPIETGDPGVLAWVRAYDAPDGAAERVLCAFNLTDQATRPTFDLVGTPGEGWAWAEDLLTGAPPPTLSLKAREARYVRLVRGE